MNTGTTTLLPGSELVPTFDDREFDLLARAVELVVLAQAFSARGLGLALRIPPESVNRITGVLESIGIVARGGWDDQRPVFASVRELPVLLAELRASRA